MKCVLLGTVVSIMLLLVADIGWAARIEFVEPVDPLPGQLLVVSGTAFGPAPGPTGPRWVSLAPIVGGVSSNAEPACPVPIVDWSENRILILVSGCEPGEYSLAIRDSNSRDFVRARESNEVRLTVRGLSGPPATGAVQGRGLITRVHPELASPGQFVDLYGDFPHPDPSNDEVILVPGDKVIQQNPDIQKQWVLQPLPGELAKQYMRVRLPAEKLAAGEYLMIPAKRRGLSGNGKRVIIRSTEPAKWESRSQFRNVAVAPFRLVTIVKNVGMEAAELDVLGLNLGTMAGPRGVHLMSPQDLDNLEHDIRHKNDP